MTSTLPIVLQAAVIPGVPRTRLCEGVAHRVLWRGDGAVAGVLEVQRGHCLGPHRHHEVDHHLWVVRGEAAVLDKFVGPGSYVHVPAGFEHGIDCTTTGGCTVFYVQVARP